MYFKWNTVTLLRPLFRDTCITFIVLPFVKHKSGLLLTRSVTNVPIFGAITFQFLRSSKRTNPFFLSLSAMSHDLCSVLNSSKTIELLSCVAEMFSITASLSTFLAVGDTYTSLMFLPIVCI